MIHHLGRRVLDHGNGRFHILLQRQYLKPTRLPRLAKGTALDHMKWMELDPLHAGFHDAMQGIEAVHRHFARQADDQMGTYLDAALMGTSYRILIGGITVTAVDPLQGCLLYTSDAADEHIVV